MYVTLFIYRYKVCYHLPSCSFFSLFFVVVVPLSGDNLSPTLPSSSDISLIVVQSGLNSCKPDVNRYSNMQYFYE